MEWKYCVLFSSNKLTMIVASMEKDELLSSWKGIVSLLWWLAATFLHQINPNVAIQYTPVDLAGNGDGECALLLNGPARSSQFDYSLNLLRGTPLEYNGPHTCITYDAVNAAYLDARKRIHIAQPHGDWKPEDVATVGELLLDVSVNLARTYGLSYEDIEKGLPLIDTSKTLIREVCPPYLSNVECRAGKYRRFDGLCTNLEHPTWGAVNTPFTR
ncbi:hypothetical protein Zmor_027785 [Zophobas morio]|uniref:Uncharacterized protein n=1 Tax=Zophobas morio TaxID=2755281 RepID=A0AA38M2D7_9CUCU|nr:hypothetical protein Zmor_027785 [Zophobas morio]